MWDKWEQSWAHAPRSSVGCSGESRTRNAPTSSSLPKLGCEQLLIVAVGQPPETFPIDVAAGRLGEADAPLLHRERSPFSTSAASTSRPAFTSASDWTKAACNAARS